MSSHPNHPPPAIHLIGGRFENADAVTAALRKAGYAVVAEGEGSEVALLVDLDGEAGTAAYVDEIAAAHRRGVPVVAWSRRCDPPSQLAAIRAGALRVLAAPPDPQRLTAMLDGFTRRVAVEPFRVLLVEDGERQAVHYHRLLSDEGMEVEIAFEPLRIVATVRQFRPDVIVSDVELSGCSGLELAVLLRQRDEFAAVPILFLAEEIDLGRQLAALELGGDDFLVKPIDPAYLIHAVTARARRSRHLQRIDRELRQALRESGYHQAALDRHAIVSAAGADGRILYVNDKFCEISGYGRDELLGHNHSIVKSGLHSPELFHEMWRTIGRGRTWQGEVCNRRKDGSLYWVEATIVPFLDDAGRPYRFVSVRTDISALKEAEAGLRRAMEESESLSRAKSDFLAAVGHELRTPLNLILGFTQLLEGDPALDEEQRDSVAEILIAARRLEELIARVVDLSAIQLGRITLEPEALVPAILLEQCRQAVREESERREIEVVVSPVPPLRVTGDRARVRQILVDLLHHALERQGRGGQVELRCELVNGGRVRLLVVDDTAPVPEAERELLFQPFTRLQERGGRTTADLTLAAAAGLAERMNGRTGVEGGAGGGNRWWLELPLAGDGCDEC